MFTFFAAFCFICVVAYVWMKRKETFFVKLSCSLVFGFAAYVVALGLGLITAHYLPSKWLVKHVNLEALYKDGDKLVFLESVLTDEKPYLHFKRSDTSNSEFVPQDGNSTVQEEGVLMVLRIHTKEFSAWDWFTKRFVPADSDKYDFIVPKDNRKNVSDN